MLTKHILDIFKRTETETCHEVAQVSRDKVVGLDPKALRYDDPNEQFPVIAHTYHLPDNEPSVTLYHVDINPPQGRLDRFALRMITYMTGGGHLRLVQKDQVLAYPVKPQPESGSFRVIAPPVVQKQLMIA